MDDERSGVFDSMTVKQLKSYLKEHGQPQSGRKCELIRLAKGTSSLLLQRISDATDNPSASARESNGAAETQEYRTVASLQGWVSVDSVSGEDWPHLTDKELYDYMVYTCHKTADVPKESKKARRQLKAHTFYDDGHVHSVSYCRVENMEECYVKCQVIPSAASSDLKKYPDRSAWVRVSTITGRVISGYCTCTAGLEGSCNHVAALLYAMVDITNHKKDGLDASTSKTCKWKQPRKRRLSPKKSMQLHKSHKIDAPETPQSGINLASFATRLALCAPKSGWLTNYTASKEAAPQIKLPAVTAPRYMFADHVDISTNTCRQVFSDFANNQACTPEERLLLEQATRDQAKSKQWHEMRVGRLTSSHFGDVFKRKTSTSHDGLLKTIMHYRAAPENEHTRWGRQHEAAGRRRYELSMKKMHPGITVKKAGLLLDPTVPYLASSPDGFVTCTHCAPTQGLLEIKCPSVLRNKTPEEACEDKHFFCHLVNGCVTLKKTHNYYYQDQGQMGVSGRQWCDFVVWTLKGHSIERIHFDEPLWKKMVEVLKSFYVQAVIPEIFTERVKRGRCLY